MQRRHELTPGDPRLGVTPGVPGTEPGGVLGAPREAETFGLSAGRWLLALLPGPGPQWRRRTWGWGRQQ